MRAEKKLLLRDIQGKIESTVGYILTRYDRLENNLFSEFRCSLRNIGAEFEVVKKRMLLKAVASSACPLDESLLDGHIGIVLVSADMLQAAKLLFQFRSQNETVLEVIGGHFDGGFVSCETIEVLSKLPSQDEIRAQFVALLEAVPAQLLSVIEAHLEKKSDLESKT